MAVHGLFGALRGLQPLGSGKRGGGSVGKRVGRHLRLDLWDVLLQMCQCDPSFGLGSPERIIQLGMIRQDQDARGDFDVSVGLQLNADISQITFPIISRSTFLQRLLKPVKNTTEFSLSSMSKSTRKMTRDQMRQTLIHSFIKIGTLVKHHCIGIAHVMSSDHQSLLELTVEPLEPEGYNK